MSPPQSASAQINTLWQQLSGCMLADIYPLRRRLQQAREALSRNKSIDKALQETAARIRASNAKLQARKLALPKPDYPLELPVSLRKGEITQAILKNQVVIVCGETGSGKTTQLPKICLELGRGVAGLIGHTQPRRIAARSVASRIAQELKTSLGEAVGYKVRFNDKLSESSYIKLMTDGILLAETQGDRFLSAYDTIIIDEAHERSLNIDFLMGYLKRILHKRRDLKVIITSATIDAERFAEFFRNEGTPAPVIEVSGRTFPVEVRYQPPDEEEGEDEVDWQRAAADACEELAAESAGDILVFMPTERDIRETARLLQGRTFSGDFKNRQTEIVQLYGRLSEKDQNRIFQSHDHRRIVIATNVAESSLTVPGIMSVVDPGTARISRFSSTSQVQRLPIEPISRASANQRTGRCGRIGPGVCVRLYSEQDFQSREEYTQPEIQRTHLASVILQMKALKLGKIEEFPFMNPPSPAAVRAGLKTLFELGAVDEAEELTRIGRALARLPVDPRIGRMILGAEDEQALEEILIITSALELRDPRDRPMDKQQAADAAHQKFQHETSDFLSLLKLWDFFSHLEETLSQSKLRKACVQNFLSFNRMREWKDLHRQLREIVIEFGIKPTDRRNNADAIHRAILSGLLANVGMRGEAHEYTGAGGQKFFLWPGSVAFGSGPKWMMAAELVETTRRFARCVAPIQPEWIERQAGHVLKRNYSDPHWHEPASCVMAFEKVLLYGLPIVPRRRCRYSHVDPKYCREQFITQGLMQGGYQSSGEFAKHNSQVKEELKELQAKLRQGPQFSSEDVEFDFYDERLPPEVFDGPRFEKWRKEAEAQRPELLFLNRDVFLGDEDGLPKQSAFPDRMQIGTMQVPVEYHLEPGSTEDGVTITIPPEGLNQLSMENLAWLVPGLLEEKIAALIKTLPKTLRILFVPAPATAKTVLGNLVYGQGNLIDQLAIQLRQISGEHVPVSAFEPGRLPAHLHFNVRVIGDDGKILVSGRDVNVLREELRSSAAQRVRTVEDERWKKDGIKVWDFGDLPQRVEFESGGMNVIAFPMLIDQDQSVSLRLADSAVDAQYQTKRGLVRLWLLSDSKRFAEQIRYFPNIDTLILQAAALADGGRIRENLAYAIAREALFRNAEMPRTREQWQTRMEQGRNQISVVVQDLVRILPQLFSGYHGVRKLIERRHPPAFEELVGELREQLAELMVEGFLSDVPLGWLTQFPRYFQAMQLRWEKATTGGFQRDRQLQTVIAPHWNRWQHLSNQLGVTARRHPNVVQYRFLIEEFRVSLFAQKLGTVMSVSEKRLNELWSSLSGGR